MNTLFLVDGGYFFKSCQKCSEVSCSSFVTVCARHVRVVFSLSLSLSLLTLFLSLCCCVFRRCTVVDARGADRGAPQLGGARIDIELLQKFLQRKIGCEFTHQFWFDSLRDSDDSARGFINMLNAHQIRTEMRSVKTMSVLCRDERCACPHRHVRNAIQREVQAPVQEPDVAVGHGKAIGMGNDVHGQVLSRGWVGPL